MFQEVLLKVVEHRGESLFGDSFGQHYSESCNEQFSISNCFGCKMKCHRQFLTDKKQIFECSNHTKESKQLPDNTEIIIQTSQK